ncbi:MAG: MBL fold metallo-hydrolase [Chloroflexi bacterium]|nr:MBL fold metallo-hydrolase [Chloroflexota bacterium]
MSDGLFMMDGGAVFGVVPKVLWQREVKADDLNRIPLYLQSLLIRSAGKTILVETGYGSKLTPRQAEMFGLQRERGLVEDLDARGVSPKDVDIVINTHLHADHCGGNTTLAAGQAVPTFPNAEYWIQRGEWQDATHPNERTRATYLADNFQAVEASGQLRLLDGDTKVTPDVKCVLSPGHTRHHQSVVVDSISHAAVFVGDIAQYKVQFERLAWISSFDLEPLVSLETKRGLMDWAIQRNAIVIAVHQPLICRVEKAGPNYRLVSVD